MQDRTNDWLEAVIMLVVVPVTSFFVVYAIKWLPDICQDNAVWFLRTQTQVAAAFFAASIAGTVFRLQHITGRETLVLDKVEAYMRRFDESSQRLDQVRLDVFYNKWLIIVNNEKIEKKKDKQAKENRIMLGKLWAIKELASHYNTSKYPPRYLRKWQTQPLYNIDKTTKEAAIKTWETYFAQPSKLILEMDSVIDRIVNALDTDAVYENQSSSLIALHNEIQKSPWIFEAERIKRFRELVLPRFYFTVGFLFFAMLLGTLAMLGVANCSAGVDLGPYGLAYLVGLPGACSVLGIVASAALVTRLLQ